MAEITRLPGGLCRHHTFGRCLYEEHLNPGYSLRWRCVVLKRWESAFDDFLTRAELFGVSQEAVPDLWERRFEQIARNCDCEDYAPCAEAQSPACAHVHGGLCRLRLPDCEGRCRHYHLAEANEEPSHSK
jgi:hypothetical protein